MSLRDFLFYFVLNPLIVGILAPPLAKRLNRLLNRIISKKRHKVQE